MVTSVISYDLVTPPGKHQQFKTAMEALGWRFERNGKQLPNTTCYATFEEGATCTGASTTAEADLRKAEVTVKATESTFKLERYYIVSFPVPPSDIRMWP